MTAMARTSADPCPVYKRPNGFGVAMLLRWDNYIPIPEDMRIWYGDDWLFYRRRGRNFSLSYAGIETEMRVTSDGFTATSITLADADAAAAHGVFRGRSSIDIAWKHVFTAP